MEDALRRLRARRPFRQFSDHGAKVGGERSKLVSFRLNRRLFRDRLASVGQGKELFVLGWKVLHGYDSSRSDQSDNI
jgi:hypothetical protein